MQAQLEAEAKDYTQGDVNRMTDEMIALRKDYEKLAFKRGVEAMREAAARECWRASDELADIPDMASEQGQAQLCATRIRALPMPEDK